MNLERACLLQRATLENDAENGRERKRRRRRREMFAGYGEEEMSEKRKKMAFLFLSIVLASFLSMLFKVFILSNNIR